jgi:hypothetical protein
VRVFISSVTYRLKDERNALPPFLRLFDHEPLRFEDFVSQDRSGREACLAGVEAAEVYVLLLGPKYGDPFPDTGLSPTHEEFRRARSLAVPLLVFVKLTDEPDEPAQQEFKQEVGHYVNGRLWKSFTDPLSLNQVVGEALKALAPVGVPLRLAPLASAPDVAWLAESGLVPGHVSAPVLELHVLAVPPSLVGAAALAARAEELARDCRASGFVSDRESLEGGSDNQRAWALRPADASRGGFGGGPSVEQFRGLIADRCGSACAFLALPTDSMGALVDRQSLQRGIARLMSLAVAHAAESPEVAFAVGLSHADRVWEGDPTAVGTRTSGSMRSRGGLAVRVAPDFAVAVGDVTRNAGDIAAELAVRMLNDVRTIPAY